MTTEADDPEKCPNLRTVSDLYNLKVAVALSHIERRYAGNQG
jgi:hypothetical protein